MRVWKILFVALFEPLVTITKIIINKIEKRIKGKEHTRTVNEYVPGDNKLVTSRRISRESRTTGLLKMACVVPALNTNFEVSMELASTSFN